LDFVFLEAMTFLFFPVQPQSHGNSSAGDKRERSSVFVSRSRSLSLSVFWVWQAIWAQWIWDESDCLWTLWPVFQ